MSASTKILPAKHLLFLSVFACAASALVPAAGHAKDEGKPVVSSIDPLIACRSIADVTARVSCYDEQVDELQQATAKNELVIMNKDDIKQTKRSLFGFTLPRLSIFGRSNGDAQEREADTQITAKTASLRSMGYGKWSFTLEDGAHWETTEAVRGPQPKSNDVVVIKQGALGSYMAEFDGGRAVRVKRVN
jgi:hypothetical protein